MNCDFSTTDLTLILQVTAVITSLLSMISGFVMMRQAVHCWTAWTWTWKDLVVDMVCNILSISPRVITLGLFASYVGDLFWIVAMVYTWGMAGLYYFIHRDGHSRNCSEFCSLIKFGLEVGYGWLFNFFCSYGKSSIYFRYFLFYWLVMFTENTVMISLWWFWSSDLHLWYHVIIVGFVVVMYLLSLMVECLHAYFYNDQKAIIEIWEWYFHPGEAERSESITSSTWI